ncbi:MAG: chromate transporter [Acholeplasmatales bacterium]|nr:chromate transporter [Acholeplasmatales bacterium]
MNEVTNNNIYDMPYLKRLVLLCLLFFKLGVVNFGGGYALLPLLSRELCDKRGWATDTELADYYAVGQCTPGAIAVNVSTFIGYRVCGVLGGIMATISFISPAFIIIFIIATLMHNFNENPYVVNALAGINVVVFVLILSAIVKLSKKSIVDLWGLFIALSVAVLAIFVNIIPLYVYIIVAAILGLLINFIKEKNKNKNVNLLDNTISTDKNEETKTEEVKEKIEVVDKKEEIKTNNKLSKKDVLMFFAGLFVGILFGLIGCISCLFIKNKKYRNGLIVSTFFWIILAICTLVSVITDKYVFFTVYFNFFRIGACAFGGGLATLPFLAELGQETGWYNNEDLTAMLAISESTPGAMGINMSTYVGYTVSHLKYTNYFLSFLGSIISTLGLISPSIIVILIISLFLQKFNENKYVKWIFYGLRAASIGLICAAAYSVLKVSIFKVVDYNADVIEHYDIISAFKATKKLYNKDNFNLAKFIAQYFEHLINYKALAVGVIFGITIFKFKKHPIFYIACGAIVGILLQMGNA